MYILVSTAAWNITVEPVCCRHTLGRLKMSCLVGCPHFRGSNVDCTQVCLAGALNSVLIVQKVCLGSML